MNTNTKEYAISILKEIETAMNETMEKLIPYSKINNGDKTPEELVEEINLKERLGALKVIKAELVRENNNASYTISKDNEVKVMLKLKAKHEESMKTYKDANREDLYGHEKAELDVINEFTPKQPTEKEIIEFTKETIMEYLANKPSDYVVSMRDMGQVMPKVKAKYPNVNGNIVKTALMEYGK